MRTSNKNRNFYTCTLFRIINTKKITVQDSIYPKHKKREFYQSLKKIMQITRNRTPIEQDLKVGTDANISHSKNLYFPLFNLEKN